MSAADLSPFFEERFREVEAYLALLEEVEESAQEGPPRLAATGKVISAPQQRILYSSVYLLLYNLVEATVTRCVQAVVVATRDGQKWRPDHLNEHLYQEWVRAVARTHVEMAPENRLEYAIQLCDHVLKQLPVGDFEIQVGGGGNWDDDAIEKMSRRIGCELTITDETRVAAKRRMRDDVGVLKLVKLRRNALAHGSLSFVECADGVAVAELRTTVERVGEYLREVIECFRSYVTSYDFLRLDSRPVKG